MNREVFKMKEGSDPIAFIIDDFYQDPDRVRQLALATPKRADLRFWKGRRSNVFDQETMAELKARFEKIIGRKFKSIQSHFHVCDVDDPLVYHCDQQAWAGAVYLTPDAPVECGTSLWKSRKNGVSTKITPELAQQHGKPAKQLENETFGEGALLDKTKWTEVDRIGNVYNRCALWRGDRIHSCSGYFGHTDQTRRLFQLIFLWE
jgi:hypothetical protein